MNQLWLQILIALLLKELVVGIYQAIKSEIEFRQWEQDLELIQKRIVKARKKGKR